MLPPADGARGRSRCARARDCTPRTRPGPNLVRDVSVNVAAIEHVVTSNEKLLAASRLFGRLSPPLRAELAARTTRRAFARGDRIFRTGEQALRFNLILSGVVKIVRPVADGSEAIVGLFGPRESIGDPAVIERAAFPAEAIVASIHAEILSIDAAPVLALATRNADVACALSRVLLDHTRALQEKIGVMSAGSVPKRLATLFLALGERFGDEASDGSLMLPLPLSRSELACLIGARVETAIRIVRRFEKSGVLTTNPQGFVVHDVRALVEETRARTSHDD